MDNIPIVSQAVIDYVTYQTRDKFDYTNDPPKHNAFFWNIPDKFHSILAELSIIHQSKGQDYDGSEQYGNIRKSAKDWGIPAWVAALIRASGKLARLQSLHKKGDLANESAIDSFNDAANYFIIARILFEEQGARNK